MGELEVDNDKIIVHSNIILYGDMVTPELVQMIEQEIEMLWNEPNATVWYQGRSRYVQFQIRASWNRYLDELEVLSNTNPRNNYFRIEDYSPINISWVDDIGSNTGYFFTENLYPGSTTAAHEYGHTLGLRHPDVLNIIGKGRPGIMYPRGTLVNPEYQYNPQTPPGQPGGTINPIHRRVTVNDIQLLDIPKYLDRKERYLGKFTSIYHPKHHKPTA